MSQTAEEVGKIAEDAQRDLDAAMPAMNAAVGTLALALALAPALALALAPALALALALALPPNPHPNQARLLHLQGHGFEVSLVEHVEP